ncbi:MAG: tetratricopeptide repeat protein, partial [Thermoplasmata archaeon]|nr:tetratricopeptide repeat protein [Thermoplasmata archaeon]
MVLERKCPECGGELKVVLTCDECGGVFKVKAFPPSPECPLCGAPLDGHYVCESCKRSFSRDTLAIVGEKRTLSREEAIRNLMKIPGVGSLKAAILYDAGFHTIAQIAQASVDDLAAVPKIGKRSAEKIKSALEKEDIKDIERRELEEVLVEEEMECPVCGTILSLYDTQCYECGLDFTSGKEAGKGEDLKALAVYDKKLETNPDDVDILFAKASTLSRLGRHAEALPLLERIVELDPSFEGVWNAKAEVHTALGQHAEAAECYRKSMEMVIGDILGPGMEKEKGLVEEEARGKPKKTEEELLDMLLGLGEEEEEEPAPPVPAAPAAPGISPTVVSEEEVGGGDIEDLLSSLLEELPEEPVEVEEEIVEEMFECPLCGTMVSGDATECPTCHAKFVVEEEIEEAGPGEMEEEMELEEIDLLAELEGLEAELEMGEIGGEVEGVGLESEMGM